MASSLSEVNSVLNYIHNVIQESGLHFVINQTPYSSYITIRRKFTAHGAYDDTFKNSGTVVVTDENCKHKEELELVKKKYENISENLQSKIGMLENLLKETECDVKNKVDEILRLENENKLKDKITQNLNCGFNEKVAELNLKVEELETSKNELLKSEKKALKKTRQKAEREALKNNFESGAESSKDENQNVSDMKAPLDTDLSKANPSLFLYSTPDRQCSPVNEKPPSTHAFTPPSPHTPPGLPPQTAATLSGYFVDSASSMFQDSVELMKGPCITVDYIKSISKINLIPRQERN